MLETRAAMNVQREDINMKRRHPSVLTVLLELIRHTPALLTAENALPERRQM
jgi:hypothetical protein